MEQQIAKTEELVMGGRRFQRRGHTYVMGILNVTPDSFSDGGRWTEETAMLKHAEEMLQQGADLLDLGGESTRPGYRLLPPEEEIQRVERALFALRAHFDVPISVDTYKYQVARAALASGADCINDIWGFRYDQGEMAALAAETKAPCILMHNRSQPVQENFLKTVGQELERSLAIAEQAGVKREQLILDPGIGFGKTLEQNLLLMKHLDLMKTWGLPWLLGTSRKSMIGLTLQLPVSEREEGTLVTTVMAVQQGAMFVRVHDVAKNVRAIRMAEAIRDADFETDDSTVQ